MKRPASSGDGGGNWMDTYGDMVTLLLTFFILLYSMSNLNEQKWEVFVKSIFPGDSATQELAINQQAGGGQYAVTGSMDTDLEPPDEIDVNKLYLALAQSLDQEQVDGVVVSRGKDYTFVIFEDGIYFDGDSSVLTEKGKHTLDIFCDTIAPLKDDIGQINIMGHTAQGNPEKPNNPRTDRMLSAMRSAEVATYIQTRDVIEPEKLVGISFGQHRPIDTFDTREGRAKNRRVEILLLDEGADFRPLDEYYNEIYSETNAATTIVTGSEDDAGGEIEK